jgi:2-polyprenyl-3-methyl-5-hydroxy-6-metoxy-1,4-benzoquinol methylase
MSKKGKKQCPVCDFAEGKGEKFEKLRHQLRWDLFKCPECTFQFWYPPIQATREYFEETYKAFADINSTPFLAESHRLMLKNMPIKSGSIMDVGCGDKLFLPEADKRGYDVWGLDFNRKVIEKNKALFNLPHYYAKSIFDVHSVEGLPKFDMITFFELLEHVEEPKRFLGTIRELLTDDGFIALSVPDLNRFGPWELKTNIAPYHTAYWTPEIVTKFLNNHGFNVVKIQKINRPDSVSMMMNLLIRLRIINVKDPDYNIAKTTTAGTPAKKRSMKSLFRIAFQWVTIPLTEFLYMITSLRPAIFVIAQRKN